MRPTTFFAPMHSRNFQGGMTLIEVLVTLVLISVGLLGIAALQVTTLRGNQEAYVRSQASALAGDILDRMRANQRGVQLGQYATPGAAAVADGVGIAGTDGGNDMVAWQAAIDASLPGGNPQGEIEVTNDRRVVTVRIRWGERGDRATTDSVAQTSHFTTFSTRTEI